MNTHMKTAKVGIPRIVDATRYSLQGLKYVWQHEAAFREEAILFVFFFSAAFFVGETAAEVALLIGTCFIVIMAEIMNSSIEAIVDRISTERHPLSGAAKDMGSAAVMIAMFMHLFIWLIIIFY